MPFRPDDFWYRVAETADGGFPWRRKPIRIPVNPAPIKDGLMPEPTFTPPSPVPPTSPYREEPEAQTRRLLAEAQRVLAACEKHIAERDAAHLARARRDKWLLVLLTISLVCNLARVIVP